MGTRTISALIDLFQVLQSDKRSGAFATKLDTVNFNHLYKYLAFGLKTKKRMSSMPDRFFPNAPI